MTPRRLTAFLLAAILAMAAGTAVLAQDTSSQESRKAKLQKEIAVIDSQLKANAAKSASATSRLTLIRTNIAARRELLAESDREIAAIEKDIKAKQQDVDRIQERLDTLSAYYSKLVRGAYKHRDAKVWYMFILSSDNVGQAFRRLGYLRGLSGRMNVQAGKINETKAELEAEKEKLLALRSDALAIRNERAAEVKAMQKDEADAKKIVDSLNKEKSKYQKELAAKKKQVDALNREIERIIREASAPKKTSGSASSSRPKTEIDQALDAEFARNKGKLPWPADGPVVEKFGKHPHPVYRNVTMPDNKGIGIAVQPGTQVHAVFDGVVRQIAVMPGYNQCVLVQHGNYYSLYGKLGSVNVKTGDKVKTGQVIGTVDTIAGQTEVHLQIWQGTTAQNPELWLKK